MRRVYSPAAMCFAFACFAQFPTGDSQSEQELQTAIALTRSGQFQDAIPHFLRVQGRVAEPFAVDFNLALCYLGTHRYDSALRKLAKLKGAREQNAAIENLRAQAYIHSHQLEEALHAFQNAVALTPVDEKLYSFVSDACLDERDYDLGLQIVNAGLRNLPDSPRLFYQRGLFRLQLDGIE
ncbi:MAG: tetratricopeptide repeat protein, partial [Acidobacteriaceae bacterium]|nr:tetratricopeptide repeat protein [Acidobacteriaceae bacterium]